MNCPEGAENDDRRRDCAEVMPTRTDALALGFGTSYMVPTSVAGLRRASESLGRCRGFLLVVARVGPLGGGAHGLGTLGIRACVVEKAEDGGCWSGNGSWRTYAQGFRRE